MKKIFARLKRFVPLSFLAILGPGLVATAAGNDAGGIATYAVAGAKFGNSILWIMLPITISFIFVQEMSARLGAATGKGFSDLVRENFAIRPTVFMMALLTLANAGILVTEFAGIAVAGELFGISKYISLPISAVFIWWLVVKGNYHKVERILLLMSAFLLSYIVTTFLASPDWGEVGSSFLKPTFSFETDYLLLILALIGTTIAPFMQVYNQSAVVEKGITMSDFKYERWDTIIGAVLSNIIAVFIIMATAATLFRGGISIETAGDAAQALTPFAGQWAKYLFSIGLLGASLLAAGVVPLTTAFGLCNAFGWESGVNRKLQEAPVFYAIFTFLIIFAATVVMSPAIPLIKLLVNFQIVNGLLLPIELVFMMKLANNRAVMGRYTNGKFFNIVMWLTIFGVGTASLLFLGSTVLSIFGFIS